MHHAADHLALLAALVINPLSALLAVNVLSTVVAIIVVDRLGRKFLLIAGVIQMVIAEIVVGVTLKYEFVKYQGNLPEPPSIGILVCICVFIAGFAWSWGPIGWLYPT